jgi:hypothetical protein
MGQIIDESLRFQLQTRLNELMLEHRDLDAAITQLGIQSSAAAMLDQLALKRMKKRKLLLKDQIAQLEHLSTATIPPVMSAMVLVHLIAAQVSWLH